MSEENEMLVIKNTADIVTARVRVRKFARQAGLDTRDQACIALATSSLADRLEMGTAREGQIRISCLDKGVPVMVKVVCSISNDTNTEYTEETFADLCWMVDELVVEALDSNDLNVTLTKSVDQATA